MYHNMVYVIDFFYVFAHLYFFFSFMSSLILRARPTSCRHFRNRRNIFAEDNGRKRRAAYERCSRCRIKCLWNAEVPLMTTLSCYLAIMMPLINELSPLFQSTQIYHKLSFLFFDWKNIMITRNK